MELLLCHQPQLVSLFNLTHCNVIIRTTMAWNALQGPAVLYVKCQCPLFADKSCLFLPLRYPFPPD